jgi:DNA-binding MarR family transcriptional regulator
MSLSTELKQIRPFTTPAEQALVNIIYTNNFITQKQKKALKKFNLSLETYNVLRILKGHYPKPITIKGITERMLDKMSNASRLVDNLVDAGLALRTIAEQDRRAVEVVIKNTGLELLSKADKSISGIWQEHQTLCEEELERLNILLDKFRNNI